MLRSHKTPVTLLHFNHPAWILWLTSLSISPSFWIICLLNLHSIYSVLALFSLKSRDFRVCLHNFNLAFTQALVSSTRANSIHHGISFWIALVNSSITMTNKNGLNVDPWCNPVVIEKITCYASTSSDICHYSIIHVLDYVNIFDGNSFFINVYIIPLLAFYHKLFLNQ